MTTEYIKLNKMTATPLYYQLKENIKEAVQAGLLKPNDKLPTEEELCRAFNISRPVIRQAYSELINEGIIVRFKGKGTFVREQEVKGSFFKELSNFSSEMHRLGLTPSTKVLSLETITYNRRVYDEVFQLEKGEKVLHVRRLRYGNDVPIVLVETFVPLKYFPDLEEVDFANDSLYDIFEKKYSTYVSKAKRTIEARIIENKDAELLQVKPHSAVHFVKTYAYDLNERMVEYSIAVYPGDRNKFDVIINRNNN